VVRVAWVDLRMAPVVREARAALPPVPVALVGAPAAAVMAALAVSAATHVAVQGPPVVGRLVIARVAIDPASVVPGQTLAPRDRVVLLQAHRARQVAASVVRLALASVRRIARQAGLDRVVRGPGVLIRRSLRPIVLTNPIVPAVARMAGPPDARRGGRISCHRLSSGH